MATDSHALITTPSAAKWYGAFDATSAKQEIDIEVQGSLEWLPCETIVFDKACVASEINIGLGSDARMLGWDLLIFGRQGSGERFVTGVFDQSVKLVLQGEIVWIDRLRLVGSDPLFDSSIGLAGQSALATFWAVAPDSAPWTEGHMEVVRSFSPEIAWTCLHPRLLVGRQVGCPILMQKRLQHAWRFLKQTYWGLAAPSLRLWAT
ncbi:MAG: urease accessory protein UreD [Burkholderiaceae bacterium]|nr:urease accessory protein UreD [Burkholderiaceae bacterium]MCD8537082.1 urease accessory protein UreD [Burkholderiaceae bacterium]MCD8564492.1 urease accessory protein UreD [Burkholderiaceae bacterium]